MATAGSAGEAAGRLALGEALFRAGHLDEAGQTFRRALALDPDSAVAYYGLARVLLTSPDYAMAGRALRQAYERDPDAPRVVRRLAGLVSSRQEALRLYRHYLELPPVEEPEVVENARAWVALLQAAGQRRLYRLEGEGPGRVRLIRSQGLPHLDVAVAGLSPRPFLLDSGAGGVTLSDLVFRRLDLAPVAEFRVRGVSGTTETRPFVLLPELQVGPFTFHDVPAVVTTGGGGAAGIVGLSVLAPLMPSLQGWRQMDLGRQVSEPGCPAGNWWRFRNINGLIRITGHIGERPVRLVLDTGASRSVLSRAALSRLELSEAAGGSSMGLTGLTGPAADVGRVKQRARLSILGSETSIRGMAVLDLSRLTRSLGTEVDGILGMDLLRAGSYTVDYAAGRLQVSGEASR